MIFIDSGVIIEILQGGNDALELSTFLEVEAAKGNPVVIMDNTVLDAFLKLQKGLLGTYTVESITRAVLKFRRYHDGQTLSETILKELAILKLQYQSFDSFQLHLLANVVACDGELLCDFAALQAIPQEKLRRRKISQRFSLIKFKLLEG